MNAKLRKTKVPSFVLLVLYSYRILLLWTKNNFSRTEKVFCQYRCIWNYFIWTTVRDTYCRFFFFCFIYQQYCFNFPSHRNCTDLCCCFRHPCSVLEQSVSLCPDLHIGKLQTWIMVWYIANKLLQTSCDILLLTLHYLFYKSVHTRWSGGRIVLPLTPGTGPQRDVCK